MGVAYWQMLIVDMMLQAARNDNNEALRTACILGKYDHVKALLRRGNIDVNFKDHVRVSFLLVRCS